MKSQHILIVVAFIFSIFSSQAQNVDQAIYALPSEGINELQVRMFADCSEIKAGSIIKIGIHFDLESGWYTYTNEETQSHLPTMIDVIIPEGFSIIKEIWPEPSKHYGSDGLESIYNQDFVVVYQIQTPKNIKESANIEAILSWQVCDANICLVGNAEMRTSINFGKHKESVFSALLNNYKF